MFQPPHFREDRLDVLHDLIRAHPLGLLISQNESGLIADPIPFQIVSDSSKNGTLQAHMSRANPHWKTLTEAPEQQVLIVFQGPQAYVTPSWYETKRQTAKVVPTWNYAIVQARGRAEIIHDTAWLATQIRSLTDSHEADRTEPWQVSDAPEKFVEAQIRGIVGLRVEIEQIDGKWKMSQNRPEADRAGVASGFRAENAAEIADYVSRSDA